MPTIKFLNLQSLEHFRWYLKSFFLLSTNFFYENIVVENRKKNESFNFIDESVLDDILLDSYFFSSYFKVSQKFMLARIKCSLSHSGKA